MNKKELTELSSELDSVMDRFELAAAEYPSLLIARDGYVESFNAIVTQFRKKSDHFRRDVAKIIEIMPSGKRGRKRDKV